MATRQNVENDTTLFACFWPYTLDCTDQHIQALRQDLSPPCVVLFGSSNFLGRDELGHSRTTVGFTRSRGVTVIAGPPDPYRLIGMIETVYCCYFSAHSDSWAPATECYPFAR